MRNTYVVGNWKMNGSKASVHDFFSELATIAPSVSQNVERVICAPSVYLPLLNSSVADYQQLGLKVGAQDCSEHDAGAYTGEVSVEMLRDVGSQFVIVGHSERRSLHGETNKVVAAKFAQVLKAGLTPILCVGETLTERESGNALSVVETQLRYIIDNLGVESLKNAIVAYEPVWAIGTGKTATPEEAQKMHEYLRRCVSLIDSDIAETLPLLYGGSVKPGNAKELFSQQDIDGGLVGGASLKAQDFAALVDAANSMNQ